MNMTATLDFTPNLEHLDSLRSQQRLPKYDFAGADFFDQDVSERDVLARTAGQVAPPSQAAAPVGVSRPVLAILLAAVIIVGFVVFGSGAAANAPFEPVSVNSEVEATTEVYIVQPGDTLWGIAERIAPAGADLRPTVDYLSETAGGASLDVGQRIVIDHAAISR